MDFVTSGNPTASALYLVDRDKQGKAYRWFNAETDKWGMCGMDMNEALDNKDKTAVGFFPWCGPLTGPKFEAKSPVHHVSNTDNPVDFPKTKKVKPAAKRMAKAKLVISQVGNTKVGSIVKGSKTVHPDGTVFYRADRNKWVCVIDGKQPAARPTKEAVINFLKKKYPNIQPVIID